MEKITAKSTLREVAQNPIGRDVMEKLMFLLKQDISMLDEGILGKFPLKALTPLTAGAIGKGTVNTVVELLNSEKGEPVKNDCELTEKWWKESVVYQIYPRSFNDSNGDGIGDLNGITEKLDYLKELGVDIIWCSPFYDSPNDDNGYDIRDYEKIMDEFGTMDDFDRMLDEIHKRDMKLVVDLVVNHTSDEHRWFQEACKSKDNPYHDYYIWKDATDDGITPPNNWKSFFSGSAWNYYPELHQWALHVFSKKQMDLNWENPAVRQDVYKMMRFWLDKGVDGFRMDVINFISKKQSYQDGDKFLAMATGFVGADNYFYGPRLHEYLHEMNREVLSKYDVFTVGECGGAGIEMSKMLTADCREELDTVFNFDHLYTSAQGRFTDKDMDLRAHMNELTQWQTNYTNHCWPTVFFENHDNPRSVSKYDHTDVYRDEISKLLATVEMTFRGTPFIYQGQELAMANVHFKSMDEMRDVESINLYDELLEKGKKAEKVFKIVDAGSRDNARTPVQWDDSKNAGFTSGTPWIDVCRDYRRYNAKDQMAVPDSTFNYFKKLIALRKANKSLVYGEFEKAQTKSGDIYCYFRTLGNERFYVELNLTSKRKKREISVEAMTPIALSYTNFTDDLRPFEANVYKV